LPLLDSLHVPSKHSLYLIFKYYPYDLRALARSNSITFSRAVRYIHSLCHALRTLHNDGYVHRDVKPENVFVSADHEIALGDFGLARGIRAPMTTGCGTLPYRAPEQLLGDAGYGAAVDIWAIGCVMYFLIFGAVPFEGRSDSDQFHQIACAMGSPSAADWPALARMPNAALYMPRNPIVREDFRAVLLAKLEARELAEVEAAHAYVDLMAQMLQWNPSRRITAEGALAHEVFGMIGPEEDLILIKEMHQRESIARPFCDFLFEAFEEELEFPRFVPPCDI
jgi:serine/threonine protein kinase